MKFYDDEEIYESLWHFLINRLGLVLLVGLEFWFFFLSLCVLYLCGWQRDTERKEKCMNDGDKNDNETDQTQNQMME